MMTKGNNIFEKDSICEDKIKMLLGGYQTGYTLNQSFYKDPVIYQAEIEKIFLKNWLFAGHTSQIPNAGDYFLIEFDTESVIIVRTKDGDINAHLNVCRHRGSRVCLEKHGTKKRFTCPYHAWSYDLGGKLMTARLMSDDFDKSENGLHPAHVELVGGLIFISLADKPLSLKSMWQDLAEVFDLFGFDRMKLAHKKSFPIAANWKLAMENYQECYHCAPSHPEYAQIHAMALAPEKFEKLRDDHHKKASRAFLIKESNCYFDLARSGEEGYQYGHNPLLAGMKSGSLGGKAVAPFLGKITAYDGGSSELMIGPVNSFLIYDDHMVGYRFTPTSLDSCCCDIFWFVHEDAIEGQDYDLEKLIWLWDVTTQADEKIIVNNQKGVNSHFYRPGRLSEMEDFEQSFLNWYLNAMREN